MLLISFLYLNSSALMKAKEDNNFTEVDVEVVFSSGSVGGGGFDA